MFDLFKNFVRDEDGATAIEYGLIAALVSVAAVFALGQMGTALTDMFTVVSTELNDAVTAAQGAGGGGITP